MEKIKIPKEKFILDACCGAKGWWIQKNHPNVIYIDIRKEKKGFIAFRPNTEIKPDIQADYRETPFPDKSFKLIAWDPPHLNHKESKTDVYLLHYGVLKQKGWEEDLNKAFKELWRILDDYGVMIFKWSDQRIPFKKVLDVFPEKALFGTTCNQRKTSKTRYFTFMKIPNGK